MVRVRLQIPARPEAAPYLRTIVNSNSALGYTYDDAISSVVRL